MDMRLNDVDLQGQVCKLRLSQLGRARGHRRSRIAQSQPIRLRHLRRGCTVPNPSGTILDPNFDFKDYAYHMDALDEESIGSYLVGLNELGDHFGFVVDVEEK